MKNKSLVIIALALIGAFSMQSCTIEGCTDKKAINFDAKANSDDGTCEYKEGCTDVTAINYDYQAGTDDGSCEFEGEVIFWINQIDIYDTITVRIDGIEMGYITRSYSHPPECGANGTFTLATEPGRYSYYAISKTGKHWEDSVNIYKNRCKNIQLGTK